MRSGSSKTQLLSVTVCVTVVNRRASQVTVQPAGMFSPVSHVTVTVFPSMLLTFSLSTFTTGMGVNSVVVVPVRKTVSVPSSVNV